MKFIILGDVHIGKGLAIGKPGAGSNLNSRIQDQLSLLNWVLKQSLDNDCKTIVITGDVYEDPRPHPALINFFMSWLKKCENAGVDVHIIAGNHDIIRTGSYTVSALDIVSSVEMLGAKVYKDVDTLHLDGVSITMVPYRDRRMYEVDTTLEALGLLKKEFVPELDKIPDGNLKVMVGHLAIEGSISIGDEIDDELNEIFCPPSAFEGWDYTWMGHVHNPQIAQDQPYYVAHIGSMERSDFSKHEMSGRKFIVMFDSDAKHRYEEIDLPNRSIHKVEVTVPKGKETSEFIKNSLTVFNKDKPLKGCILKLEVKLSADSASTDRQSINEFLYDTLGIHYICHFTESRKIGTISINPDSVIGNDISPSAAINAYWDKVDEIEDDEKEECRALGLKIDKLYEESLKK